MVNELTESQRKLIALLIEVTNQDADDRERRWQKAGPFVKKYSEQGQLPLVRDWTEDTIMTQDGSVLVIDTEDGRPARSATEAERRVALFRSLRRYPELLSLMPERPRQAATCPGCHGTGVPEPALAVPGLRDLICVCGGAGWVIESAP